MISLTELVLRLRDQCPSFANRVGGTAEFGEAMQDATADLAVPFCFVVPVNEMDMSALIPDDQVTQDVRSFFATIIAVDNTVNRGKPGGGLARLTPFDQIVALKVEIQKAFMHWRPVQRFEPVRYYRSESLGMDNLRLWHQFEWYAKEQYVDRQNGTDLENQIAQIVNEVTDYEVPDENQVRNTLRTIYANYGLDPDAIDAGLSLDDAWNVRAMAAHDIEDASPDAIAAKRASAETIQVPDDYATPEAPSPREIGAKASRAPVPPVTPAHGRTLEEEP